MDKQQQRAIDAASIARFRAEQQSQWGLSGGLLTLSLSRMEQGEDDQPPPSSRRRRKKKRRSAGLQEKRGGAQA